MPASEIPDYAIRRDTLDEAFSPAFLERLKRINAIVEASGETLEGNLLYADGEARFAGRPPADDLAPARRNLWRAARFKDRLLEVGVNAGHSALLALRRTRSCNITASIVSHGYTIACVDFLKGEFPGRVHLFPGDSREVLPWLADRSGDLAFDLFSIRRRSHERGLPLRHDQLHPHGRGRKGPAPYAR